MGIDKFGHSNSISSANSIAKRGLPGVGFKLTNTGDFDISNKRLKFVSDPEDDGDAINRNYFYNSIKPVRISVEEIKTHQKQMETESIKPLQQSLASIITKQQQILEPENQKTQLKLNGLRTDLNNLKTETSKIQLKLNGLRTDINNLNGKIIKITEPGKYIEEKLNILESKQNVISKFLEESVRTKIETVWKQIDSATSNQPQSKI